MSSLNQSFCLSPRARFRTIDEEAVVVVQDRNKVIILNDVSTRILELTSTGTNVKTIIHQLLEEFDIDEETLTADATQHFVELQQAGIIKPCQDV